MKVFKFGGGIIRDAAAIKKVHQILCDQQEENVIAVFSAMGKTTNAFENLVNKAFTNQNFESEFEEIKKNHFKKQTINK